MKYNIRDAATILIKKVGTVEQPYLIMIVKMRKSKIILGVLRSKSSSNEMTVYPNPITDFIQIEHKTLTEISVINLQGQVMHKQNIDSRVKYFSIDVSNLPNGQYLIMTKDAKGEYFYTKFQKI
jgi:hypothetical protein